MKRVMVYRDEAVWERLIYFVDVPAELSDEEAVAQAIQQVQDGDEESYDAETLSSIDGFDVQYEGKVQP
jgi:hypothetical protein